MIVNYVYTNTRAIFEFKHEADVQRRRYDGKPYVGERDSSLAVDTSERDFQPDVVCLAFRQPQPCGCGKMVS
jgi:hypothetical protein